MADEIKLTPRDSWILSVFARLPSDLPAGEKTSIVELVNELSSDALKDVGRVLLGQKARDQVEPGVLEIIDALKEWAERNTTKASPV